MFVGRECEEGEEGEEAGDEGRCLRGCVGIPFTSTSTSRWYDTHRMHSLPRVKEEGGKGSAVVVEDRIELRISNMPSLQHPSD